MEETKNTETPLGGSDPQQSFLQHSESSSDEQGELQRDSFAGINFKKGFTKRNFFGAFILLVTGFTALVYLNTQTIFILRDKDYFNVSEASIGRVSNLLLAIALPFQFCFSFVSGIVFDIFGRVYVLLIAGIVMSILVALVPFTAPSLLLLAFLRILLGISAQPSVVMPLINDYVKKGSRGKATSFNAMSVVIGEILSIGILF